jgi:hypothetical protein
MTTKTATSVVDGTERKCQREGCRRKSEWLVLGKGRLEDGGLCNTCVLRLHKGPITLRDGQVVVASYIAVGKAVPIWAMVRAVPQEQRG